MSRYSLVKQLLIKVPGLRSFGANAFMYLPDSISPAAYNMARKVVFRDNFKRLPTFEQAIEFYASKNIVPDYLEFGVARGTSLISTYQIAESHSLNDMRFFAFDSFAGLPNSEADVFVEGDMAYAQDTFKRFCRKAGLSLERIHIVPGFFDKSLKPEVIEAYSLGSRPSLIHIDCDLYSSTKIVLDFVAKFIRPNSIIIFDDWYNFAHCDDPENYGERKAFHEWQLSPRLKPFGGVENWNYSLIYS